MSFDFALFLTLLVLVTGVVTLLDWAWWRKRRLQAKTAEPLLVEYARSFFPVLLIVWVIRSFIMQPYRVPTGSLEPTIMPGDFIAVGQYAYGIRLPVLHTKIINVGEPKRGDIALFRWPVHPSIVFVKRVIGVPGDHIVYRNKVLYINGKEADQHFIRNAYDYYSAGGARFVQEFSENLDGVKHEIYVQPVGGETKNYNLVVPKGEYFMMGDNRDNSDDSRMWGFVPENNLIGRALMVWMSWDSLTHSVRWHRIGTRID